MSRLNRRADARPMRRRAPSSCSAGCATIGGGAELIDAQGAARSWARTCPGSTSGSRSTSSARAGSPSRPPRRRARWVGPRRRSASSSAGSAVFVGFNLPSDGLVVLGGALDRGRDRDADPGPSDAVADDARGDDPGDARGVSADAGEDDGAGAVDGPGRATTAAIPLIETPDDAVVWGVALGLQQRGRAGPGADGRRRQGRVAPFGYLPAGTGQRLRRRLDSSGGAGGWAPGLMSSSADPELRRHDGGPGHDRELASLVGLAAAAAGRRRRPGGGGGGAGGGF